MWIKDPKTGEKSVTITLMVIGFVIASLKLLLSDVKIEPIGLYIGPFGGTEFAAVVGALGAVYGWRKLMDRPEAGSGE